MPVYEYRCARGHLTDEFRSVDCRSAPATCGVCGDAAEKVISSPAYAVADIAGYRSMQTGEWIGSRSQHRAHLSQHNLTEIGNEKPKLRAAPRGPDLDVREDILRAVEGAR